MEKSLTDSIAEQTTEVLGKVYDDVIHPSAEPVGQVLSYLPRTLRLWFSKWERWLINGEENLRLTSEALRDKVKTIPEEKLCEPEAYVAVPIMQQLAYCYDSSELRDMYANLLAASMNTDKKWQVHPGYIDVIKQLTPDEAKLLSVLPKETNEYVPLITLKVKLGDYTKGEEIIKQNYTNAWDDICDQPQNISLYLDDLARLKIIDIPDGQSLVNIEKYESIKNSEYIQKLKAEHVLAPDTEYDFEQKVMNVTEYGRGFILCCID